MSAPDAHRQNSGGLAFVVVITLVSVAAALFVGQRIEERIGDIFLSIFNVWSDPSENIVVVAIDEDTLATLPYRSPIDRGFLAALISRIDAAKPAVIGVDILIDQVSEPAKDEALRRTLEATDTPVIMGAATEDDGLTGKQAAFLHSYLEGLRTGLVTLLRDRSDGAVRRLTLGRDAGENRRDGLAAAMAKHVKPGLALPDGRITYYSAANGGPHTFPVYPAHTVSLLPADWFAGKAVLIGATLPTGDLHQTPFTAAIGAEGGLIHGVFIHANMLAQMLNGDRLRTFSTPATLAIVLAACIAIVLVFTAGWPPLLKFAATATLLMLLWAGGVASFTRWHTQLPLAGPTVGIVLAGVLLSVHQWLRDRKQRQFIERAFSQYVSPALVKRIVANQQSLSLGGEKRLVTYVFTDLERFTSLAERLEAQEVAGLLNEYLDQICERFIAAEATIDKIVGDAVIGFFGAPESQDDQAVRAIDLALAIDRFSQDYRQTVRARGIDLGVTRVGVHGGEAIVGNFGGSRFFDYTAIGDTVNTAARLEGANRTFGTRILISETVANAAPEQVVRSVGTLVLKGKSTGIRCYEPVAPADVNAAHLDAYRRAFDLVESGSEEAEAALNAVDDVAPGDPLAGFYQDRLARGERGTIIHLSEK